MHKLKLVIAAAIVACAGLASFADWTSVKAKLDANGGKVTSAAFSLDYNAEMGKYRSGDLPEPNARQGYVFEGWFTAKTGGTEVLAGTEYAVALFAGQKTPTLYAHWIKAYTVTLKDDSAYLYYSNEEHGLSGDWSGKGTVTILAGSEVEIFGKDYLETQSGAYLQFQKWTLTPSAAVMGANFRVGSCETSFTMPAANVTLQAAYVDPEKYGYLSLAPSIYSSTLGDVSWYDPIVLEGSAGSQETLTPAEGALQWSPDGGKAWYDISDVAMVELNKKCNISFRSLDSSWQAPTGKWWAMVYYGDYTMDVSDRFTFVYVIQPDIITLRNGVDDGTGAGGTVTMNPKTGIYSSKGITLSAKAAKNFAFQGWKTEVYCGERSATWKLYGTSDDLTHMLNGADGKVHVQAVFKAVSDYRAEDLVFNGFNNGGSDVSYDAEGKASIDLYACVGCELSDVELDWADESYPLTYKLSGKLPSGMKFDAKTGAFSGAPTKTGDATVTITATDPAKNTANVTVRIHVRALPSWVAGDFRALAMEFVEDWNYEAGQMISTPTGMAKGVAEVSVSSAAKVSVKYTDANGTQSCSGKLVWVPDDADPTADGSFSFDGSAKSASIALSFDASGEKSLSVSHWVYYSSPGIVEGYEYRGALSPFVKADYLSSPFKEKYYTFAFQAVSNLVSESDYWYDDYSESIPSDAGG